MKKYSILKYRIRYSKYIGKVNDQMLIVMLGIYKYIYLLLLSYTDYVQYYPSIHNTHLSIREGPDETLSPVPLCTGLNQP